MDFLTLVRRTRTCRRFDQYTPVASEALYGLIDMARLGGSARNMQPWQYMVINDAATCQDIFPHLGWAGYLADWKGPETGEQPSAYVLCYLNREWLKSSEKEAHFDLGIATQNLLLGATAMNLQGCRIASFSPKLADVFATPEHLELHLVIALGFPVETVVVEDMTDPGDVRYWRDEARTHHVPKRLLDDILITPETLKDL